MRAARRMRFSVPGAPVNATRTRSRVSHGCVMPWRSRYSSSASSTFSTTQRSASSRERAEVAGAEVVRHRGVDPLSRVDVAVRHSSPERLGSLIDQFDLLRFAHDLVGDRLALGDPGDALDDVVQRLEVLDVDGRDHVDSRVEDIVDVLPALVVARAGHIRVRELVDQRDLWLAGQDRVDVHLLEGRPPVRDGLAWRDLQVGDLLDGAGRPWASTYPTTTSVPRDFRLRPSLSIA